MLLSSTWLCSAKKCYDSSNAPTPVSNDKPINKTLAFLILTLAIALFIMELIVLVYAVRVALACSEPGANRITHVILAVFFTIPYLLFALFMGPCHKRA